MWRTLMIGSLLGLLSGCSGLPFGQGSDRPNDSAEGKASYYGARHHGQRTASGERFDDRCTRWSSVICSHAAPCSR